MKYMSIKVFLVVTSFLLCLSCTEPEDPPIKLPSSQLSSGLEVIQPRGNEIEMVAVRESPNKYKVKIINTSNQEIFCAYIPGKSNGIKADYFPYIKEKRNFADENFTVVDSGGSFAPKITSIKPQEVVEIDFFSIKEGVYRLRFSYLVDKHIVDFINSEDFTSRSEEMRNKIESSFMDAVSPLLTIEKSIQSK